MANDVTEKPTTEGLEPRVERDKPLARVQALPWLLLILALAAVAWLTWRAFFYDERADPISTYLEGQTLTHPLRASSPSSRRARLLCQDICQMAR